jgi:hypothetical protein
MAAPAPLRGLSAAELAAACAELHTLAGAVVLDLAPLVVPANADDLLLVLQCADGAQPSKRFLHIAPGGPRARLCTTARRFAAEAFARGPARDLLQRELLGATLTGAARCTSPPRPATAGWWSNCSARAACGRCSTPKDAPSCCRGR